MSTPTQMYTHELNGVKNFYPASPWVVDKALDLDPAHAGTAVKAGMVVHQDAVTKKWKLGIGALTSTVGNIPFLVFQNGDDYDVVGDDGNFTGSVSGGQRARIMGLSCANHAEVESTEYLSGTYTPGKFLTAGSDGKLVGVPSSGATIICGVVSDGTLTSEHSNAVSLLRFHTVFIPRFS